MHRSFDIILLEFYGQISDSITHVDFLSRCVVQDEWETNQSAFFAGTIAVFVSLFRDDFSLKLTGSVDQLLSLLETALNDMDSINGLHASA